MRDTPSSDVPRTEQDRHTNRRPSLFRRLIAFLLGPEPEPAQPLGVLNIRTNLDQPIIVPARGHVFHFAVHGAFVWSSDGIPREDLHDWIRCYLPRARRDLRRMAAETAREFAPHRGGDMEVELQRVVGKDVPWRYSGNGVTISCSPHVSVKLDQRVKAVVAPFWERLIKMDYEQDVQLKRAQYAETLSKRWLTVLDGLIENPLAGGASQMTEAGFAKVFADVLEEKKEGVRRLNELIEQALRTSDFMGAYEQAQAFDMLIQQLKQQSLRVPVQAAAVPGDQSHAN